MKKFLIGSLVCVFLALCSSPVHAQQTQEECIAAAYSNYNSCVDAAEFYYQWQNTNISLQHIKCTSDALDFRQDCLINHILTTEECWAFWSELEKACDDQFRDNNDLNKWIRDQALEECEDKLISDLHYCLTQLP